MSGELKCRFDMPTPPPLHSTCPLPSISQPPLHISADSIPSYCTLPALTFYLIQPYQPFFSLCLSMATTGFLISTSVRVNVKLLLSLFGKAISANDWNLRPFFWDDLKRSPNLRSVLSCSGTKFSGIKLYYFDKRRITLYYVHPMIRPT